jgi:FMN-dependent NADH-azoreductase
MSLLRPAQPDGNVIYRDLAANPLKPADALWIGAAYTPPGGRTMEQTETLAPSEELIGELERADEYVFGVAMHNLTRSFGAAVPFPMVSGPRGRLQGRKATVVVANGGGNGCGCDESHRSISENH